MEKLNVRIGNTGFFNQDTKTYISTANGCLRTILIRAYAGQPKADYTSQFTFGIGLMAEKLVLEDLKTRHKIVEHDIEMREAITSKCDIVGHCDFKCDSVIFEHKSISSVNSTKKIYVGGDYKVDNVAQLVNYMLVEEQTTGILMYTVCIWSGIKGVKPGHYRNFAVHIDDTTGEITVDNTPYPFTAQDILGHRIEAAKVLENKLIYPERPESLDKVFHCCSGCDYESACDKFDVSKDDDEFWLEVKKILDTRGRRV